MRNTFFVFVLVLLLVLEVKRSTSIQDLTDSQNLTAQALETLKTQVFTWLAKRSNLEPAPPTIAAMNYLEVFLAEVRGAQDKLEYLFDSSDPALSAANERIRHALHVMANGPPKESDLPGGDK